MVYDLLKSIRLYDYSGVMMMSAVGYDYFLTLSNEIDYVWCRKWTWVSTLFVVIRYTGLCWIVSSALNRSNLLPGPVNVCTAIAVVHFWAYAFFLAAADLVMIWRVYAMWKQSKTVLCILLFIYVPQIFVTFIFDGIYEFPGRTLLVKVQQLPGFGAFCTYPDAMFPYPVIYRAIPRFVLGTALLTLAIIPPVKQAVEMYRVTKQWRAKQSTVKLLVREGAVYFIVNLLFNILGVIQPRSRVLTNVMYLLNAVCYSLACAIMPRFIINIRQFYDRDHRNQWRGIDSGFGSSRTVAVLDIPKSTIAFADHDTSTYEEDTDAVGMDVEDAEVIQLGVVRDIES